MQFMFVPVIVKQLHMRLSENWANLPLPSCSCGAELSKRSSRRTGLSWTRLWYSVSATWAPCRCGKTTQSWIASNIVYLDAAKGLFCCPLIFVWAGHNGCWDCCCISK
jgi:hypothetical protein